MSDTNDIMYRFLVQGVTDYAIYMLSPEGLVENWNVGAERAKGYCAEEIVGRHFSCFYLPEDRIAGLPEQGLATARAHGRFGSEGWRVRKDGTRFWAHVVIDAIHDDNGTFMGFAKITCDRTEQRRTERELKAASDNLDLALSSMPQGLCLLDDEGRLVFANERFRKMLDLPPSWDLTSLPISSVLHCLFEGQGGDLFSPQHLAHIKDVTTSEVSELTYRQQALAVTIRAVAAGGWVVTFADVSERRRTESRIRYLADHDQLTGLANRATLQARLADQLRETRSQGCTVLYLDLDRFKPVNDTFGQAVGDKLLTEVASRLKCLFRDEDTVARLGGDAFAIMVPVDSHRALGGIARRLLKALRKPYAINEVQIVIGASIGIAIVPEAGTTIDTLLGNADLALYEAKRQGGGRVCFYDAEMSDGLVARRTMETDLRRALKNREFTLHYQPVFRLSSGTLIGFEALLRWRMPDGRTVSPSDFIPVAEDLGLMPEIGTWVLREACRVAAAWPEPLVVAVNVSPTQLRNTDLIATVEAALAESSLPACRLEIEITETAILANRAFALSLLKRLRAFGVLIALDDFGTGYSSLSFVHTFPLTRIKIDSSFIKGLGVDPQSMAIVRAVVSLARNLDIAVTAEGVENPEQQALLLQENCLDVQGFLFGRPQPLHDLGALLAAA
ncbi:EAL domain-containing protein [Methylobacterium sp. BTF04]|uniref:putative bifunctional diguanylate cyclase/phosphodiesterase n=1 Tax=Methylobacterium sp. BTF04 TaxID=2708300 RepID=UPI0013D0B57D|nr:EAL domain-containing protein [Methylobacterium sp. BTF04]NEU13534.1 EAL domain-containing protein [Methylobacterium sp. BTF04]